MDFFLFLYFLKKSLLLPHAIVMHTLLSVFELLDDEVKNP